LDNDLAVSLTYFLNFGTNNNYYAIDYPALHIFIISCSWSYIFKRPHRII